VAAASHARPAAPEVLLPARWQIEVDVFNGTSKGNAAAALANKVAGLAYKMGSVGNAKQKNYERTLVYYPPGGEGIAARLAGELGVGTAALPGGDDPLRLVVIVGKTV
jgi:LytR cell envelope-related transcriptional attenuator